MLGGSFNPAHEGHLHVAHAAMKAAGLDQLWLMVSPGNPLKPETGMAPFIVRLASAARLADGRRIIATGIEQRLHTRYTIATITKLKQRFPRAKFVWIIGADNFNQLPKWHRWTRIMRAIPILIIPRPGQTRRALAGKAAARFAQYRLPARAALKLAAQPPPAWILLPVKENAGSSTAIRAQQTAKGFPP